MFVSGGLTPTDLRGLRDVVDGFGVGGFVSNATPVDFGLDIVEVAGEPAAKRGKLSGTKAVYRTPDGGHHVALASQPAPADATALLEPLLVDGTVSMEFDIDDAAARARQDARAVSFRQ